MRTEKVSITADSQSLADIGNFENTNINEVLIQAPTANANTIYFGQKGKEYGELVNGGSAGLNIKSLKNVYVKGTPPDSLIIITM